MSGDEWWMSSGTLSNSSLTDFEVLSRPSDDDTCDDEVLRDFDIDDSVSILSSLSSDGSDNDASNNSILGHTLENFQAMLRGGNDDLINCHGDNHEPNATPPMNRTTDSTTNDERKYLNSFSIFHHDRRSNSARYLSEDVIAKAYHSSEFNVGGPLSDNGHDDKKGSNDGVGSKRNHQSTSTNVNSTFISKDEHSNELNSQHFLPETLPALGDDDIALLGLGKTNDDTHAFFRILARQFLTNDHFRNVWCYELGNSCIEPQLIGVIRGAMADFFSSKPSTMDLQLWNERKELPLDLPIAAYIYYAHEDSSTWNVSHYSLLKRYNIPAFPITEDSVDALNYPSILASPRGPLDIKSKSFFCSAPAVRPLTVRQMENFHRSVFANDFCNLLRLSRHKSSLTLYPVPIGVIQQEALTAYKSRRSLKKLSRSWRSFSLPDTVALLAIFVTLLLQYYDSQYGGFSPAITAEKPHCSIYSVEHFSTHHATTAAAMASSSVIASSSHASSLSGEIDDLHSSATHCAPTALSVGDSLYGIKDFSLSEIKKDSFHDLVDMFSNNSWNLTAEGITSALSVIHDSSKSALAVVDNTVTLLISFYQNVVYPTLQQYGETLSLAFQELMRKVGSGDIFFTLGIDDGTKSDEQPARNVERINTGTVTLVQQTDFMKKWQDFYATISSGLRVGADSLSESIAHANLTNLLKITANKQAEVLKNSSHTARRIWEFAQKRSVQTYLTAASKYHDLQNNEQVKDVLSKLQSNVKHALSETPEKLSHILHTSSEKLNGTLNDAISVAADLTHKGYERFKTSKWRHKWEEEMGPKYERLIAAGEECITELKYHTSEAASYLNDKASVLHKSLFANEGSAQLSVSNVWKRWTDHVSKGYRELGQQAGPKVSSVLQRFSTKEEEVKLKADQMKSFILEKSKSKIHRRSKNKRRWSFRGAKPTRHDRYMSILSR